MIETASLLALAAVWLINNPAWLNVTPRRKPFNCAYCMGFWIAMAFILLTAWTTPFVPLRLLIAPASSILAAVIDRFFNSLPVSL